MGIVVGEIKPSMAILYKNELYLVINCEHAKIARGAAFCRVKLRNMKSSQILEATLRDSDNIERAYIEKRKLQYVYKDAHFYHFLTMDTYEDLILEDYHIEDKIGFLKDNLEINGLFFNNELLDLELPMTMELKITHTDPGFRGDTVKAGTKSATLETGLTVNVPLFINVGDLVKIDTRTSEYLGRA
ncbi:MAG: elongation factor P [Candidatus Omnitrophica bacterium]|nr:elongation factor P [Candidatus Omnitrophota bacterium]